MTAGYRSGAAAGDAWPAGTARPDERTAHDRPHRLPQCRRSGLYRTADNPGVWPHRGKVAAVGIGHSPTLRRWDGDPQKASARGPSWLSARPSRTRASTPAEVDGLVFDPIDDHRRVLAGRRAGPGGLPGRVREHQRPVRRADQAQPGVAGEEPARADRPEVRDARADLHVDVRGRGDRVGGPRDGRGGPRREGLAQHPRPVRPRGRARAGHRGRAGQVRPARLCGSPGLRHRACSSSGTCTSTTRPTT